MKMIAAFARGLWGLLSARLFWKICVLPIIFWGLLAVLTPDPVLIIILRVFLIAFAVNVCVAYGHETFMILSERAPFDRQGKIIVGVFLSWSTYVYLSALSLIWRYYGQPPWVLNSDLASLPIFVGCGAAALHLSPHVMHGRVPTRRLLYIGMILAIATAIALFAVYATDIYILWQRSGIHRQAESWMRHMPPGAWATTGAERPEDFRAGPSPELKVRPQSFGSRPPDGAERLILPLPPSEEAQVGPARIGASVTQDLKDEVERYRVAHGLHSGAEAVRELVDHALKADERKGSEPFECGVQP